MAATVTGKKATMYNFNPRNTGLYEARVWEA